MQENTICDPTAFCSSWHSFNRLYPTLTAAHPPIKVFYAGPDGGVKTALDLAVQSDTMQLVEDADSAQVILLNGQIPDPERMCRADRTPAPGWFSSWAPTSQPKQPRPCLGTK